MDDLISILIAVFGFLGGGGGIIALFVYYKQQKRFKNAEAVEKEVSTLRASITELEHQVNYYVSQLKDVQAHLANREAYIMQLYKEKHELEIKHAKNKSAINLAHTCEFCEKPIDCPVLRKRTLNEEEYLKRIETNHVQS